MNDVQRFTPPIIEPTLSPVGSTCPVCRRPEALRTTRTASGRQYRCRFAETGDCSWEGAERPFRRAPVERMSAAFAERLAKIAERVVDECHEAGDAVARVDPTLVTALRAAIRRAARARGMQVRTAHLGDGRIEIRSV
ncbi:MAG: hypothetical protein ACXIVQ_05195 [Acidimicrobiales bacterium]